MTKSASLTEQMLVDATARAVSQGLSFEPGILSLKVWLRVDKAVKKGAVIPVGGFCGSFDAEIWLRKWEKK